MQTGPSIHPVTRKPKTVWAERDHVKEQFELKRLKRQAEQLEIRDDPAVDLLLSRIAKRVDQLITDDAEAQAYVGLLNDLGREYNLAQRAAKILAARSGLRSE